MPLQSFRTWVTGEIVTAAQLNEQIRDNGGELIKGGATIIFDGGGAPLTTDKRYTIPETAYKLTIDAVTLKSSDSANSDNFIVDIRVPVTASDQGAASDSICASALPTLDTDNPTYKRDATLTGWTPTIAEGSAIDFVITSVGGVTAAQLGLTWVRSS